MLPVSIRMLAVGAALVASASAASAAPTLIENFEFATDNAAAATGSSLSADPGVTITLASGTGADANQGSFALGLNLDMPATGFLYGSVNRTLASPLVLSKGYNASNAPGSTPSDLHLELDIKGNAAFAGSIGTNIWMRIYEADGDVWRFINFTDAALGTATWSNNHAIGYYDRETGSSGDGTLSAITGYQILIQNPEAVAKNGTLFFDELTIVEPTAAPVTGLTYTLPVIAPGSAPNVTDSVFDPIYSNSGAHDAIEGDDWKDWAARSIDAGSPISGNATAGAAIFANSKAYILSDGVKLYFGMIVYDPNTAAMTADTGDDSFTKYNVEDIEVAFSPLSGTAGAASAVKFSMDAFGHIDDMFPDGSVTVDSSAVTNSNSYIIDSTHWACEFSIGLEEIVDLSTTALAAPLPAGANVTWYSHIGYQAPFSGPTPRVPLYAAGHANGFGNLTVQLNLSTPVETDAASWNLYR